MGLKFLEADVPCVIGLVMIPILVARMFRMPKVNPKHVGGIQTLPSTGDVLA